jgi:hypothetical protein
MRYLFILFLGATQFAQAQQTILLDTYGHYNSTGVRRQVADAFFYGGLIDSSQINQSLTKLSARNAFGLQMGFNAQWQTPWALSKDAKNWGSGYRWVLGAGIHQYGGIHFSKDLFGLVFQGGLPYMGDSLDISNLRVESTTFSKVGFGLVNNSTQSSFLVHFVAVQNHIAAALQKGTWLQYPSSAQIDLTLQGEAQFSGASPSAYGVAFDLDYRFGSSENDEAPQQFQFQVQNFGVARSTRTTQYNLLGSFQYAGYSLAQWQQASVNELSDAFLDSLGYEKSTVSSWILLPAQFQLAKVINWDSPQRLEAYYGAQFILRQTYTPLIYAGAHYKVKKAWQTGLGMAYGGFGGLRVQAYSAFHFKRSQLLLRSDNIALQNGASLYLQFRCDF